MKRTFTKYPSGYVKASSEVTDFSTIPWKEQPTSLRIGGNDAHYMCYSKDLGNGYYADVKPRYNNAWGEIIWQATISDYSNPTEHHICGFATFDNSYDATQWVDYDGYNYIGVIKG